ncbi:MAG: polysaccharide biosynthesis C-terminal domain-containing protein [Clostridia bacterium]|nr:polysaccharide biosynthesis C-terminal domain-containing protein [Clostridia bacterium]
MKENRTTKKESFMQGVFTLMFSQVLIKILGLVYTLYLTNREGFGDKGNAVYASGYQIYALLLTISSIGVPNAISKLISERVAVGNHRGADKVFKIAFVTFAFVGFIGTVLLFCGAKIIAQKWLQIPDAEMTLVALSPAIFFVSISSVMRGYFNGRKTLKATAKAQIIEQVFKTMFTIIIVEIIAILTNTSTKLMAAGANIATTIATFTSFAYLFLYYKLKRSEIKGEISQTINYRKESVFKIVKNVLMVSIPMTISSVLSSINKNIDAFTVKRILSTYMTEEMAIQKYGMLSGKVETLINLPLSINIAFATALVPAIAAARAQNDMESATKRTSFSLLISMLIGLPCTVGMCIFSQNILNLLYPNANEGGGLLKIAAISIIFSILSQTINGALQGFGKVMVPAMALSVGVVVKFILNITLLKIPEINVYGAAFASAICYAIAFVITFIILKKNVKLNLKVTNFIIKPIIATTVMGVCSYSIFLYLKSIIIEKVAILISIVIATIIYGIMVILLKILTKEEMKMLPYGVKIYKILEKVGIY